MVVKSYSVELWAVTKVARLAEDLTRRAAAAFEAHANELRQSLQ
jgi:hypothetical protein